MKTLQLGITVCATVLALPAAAAAQTASLELDGAGRRTIELEAGRPPTLRVNVPEGATGEPARLELPEGAPAVATGIAAETLIGPRNARLGRVTLTTEGGTTYEALVAVTGRPAAPKLVWAGWTGLRGDPGERYGERLEVGDVDGDGKLDVLVGVVSETTTVCGVAGLPLLHRRAYDWAGATLRPVSGPREGLDPQGATAVAPAGARFVAAPAQAEDANGWRVAPDSPSEAGAVLLPLLEYRGASSSHGDDGNPLHAAAPSGLEDMQGTTGWAEGVGGAGRLEFATARLVTPHLPGRWLAVRAADDGDPDAAKTRGRPKELLVVDGEGRRWRLAVPDDAATRGGAVLWYELPEASAGGCISVALLDAVPATSAEGRRASVTWLSDVQLFAALRLPEGAEALRALLEDDGSPAAAQRALRALGAAAVPALAGMAPALGGAGAGRAAAFLAAREEPEAAAALAALLGAENASAARAAREALARRGAEATPLLVRLLDAEPPAARTAALERLAESGGPEALEPVAGKLDGAGEAERPLLRRTLAAMLARAPEPAAKVAAAIETALAEGKETLAVDLLRVLPLGEPGVRAAAGRLVAAALPIARSFEARYHLVLRAGALLAAGETAPAEPLRALAQAAAEPELRVEATRALAEAPADLDLAPLLADAWPGVREAAATAIGRRGREAELRALATTFAEEPWPLVRAAAAEAFLRVAAWPGDDVARRLLEDPAPLVRERAIGALAGRDDEPAGRMLAEVVERHTERLELRQRALGALARRCWPELKPLVIRVVEHSVRTDARRGDQALALDAIRALGTAGPPNVRSLLEEIVREAPVPVMLAAALQALGDLGEPDAAAVVEPYRRHADPAVAEAAEAALRALERGRAGRRCGEAGR